MKRCPRCGLTKAKTEFNHDNTKRDGRRTYCKQCDRAAGALRYTPRPPVPLECKRCGSDFVGRAHRKYCDSCRNPTPGPDEWLWGQSAFPYDPWKNYSPRARRLLAPIVKSGQATCNICGQAISPTALWDVDHFKPRDAFPELIGDPNNWTTAHRRCNRRQGALYVNEKRRQMKRISGGG